MKRSGIFLSFLLFFSCQNRVVKEDSLKLNNFSQNLQTLDYEIAFVSPEIKRGGSGVVVIKKNNNDIENFFIFINDSLKIKFVPYKFNYYLAFFGWPLTYENFSLKIIIDFKSTFSLTNKIEIKLLERKYAVNNIKMGANFGMEKEEELNEKLPKDPIKRYNAIVSKLNERKVFDVFDYTYKNQTYQEGFRFIPEKPTDGYVTSDYGVKRNFWLDKKLVRSSYHYGIDYVKGTNFNIYSVERGKVVFAGYNGASGNYILIDHGYGIFSGYSHCERLYVKEGDLVDKKSLIAISGKTGYVTGDHLHFSLIINGMNLDPNDWFNIEWLKHNIVPAYEVSETLKISGN
ncbi:MAG: M23 family metallopeptidase [Brevinematales bacterium]|nr:M23 family metallopeptidase [Brevinematales bacterium]